MKNPGSVRGNVVSSEDSSDMWRFGEGGAAPPEDIVGCRARNGALGIKWPEA